MKKLIIVAITALTIVGCKSKPEASTEKASTEANTQKMEVYQGLAGILIDAAELQFRRG